MNKEEQVANAEGRQREEIIYSGKAKVSDPGFKWWKLFKPGKILREGCSSFIVNHLGLCYSLITLRYLSYHLVSLFLSQSKYFCGAQKHIGRQCRPA